MALAPPSPDAGDLRALAAKYRQLAALRVQRDSAGATSREALRALAARHPGCLRELDTLGLAELERRGRVMEAAAAGGPREPWIAWVWAYHRLMQATLLVKRAVGRGGAPGGEALQLLRDEASRLAGLPLDDTFVTEVACPPQGRIGVLVLRRLGQLFGAPAAEIARTLFPPRRDSPYTLG